MIEARAVEPAGPLAYEQVKPGRRPSKVGQFLRRHPRKLILFCIMLCMGMAAWRYGPEGLRKYRFYQLYQQAMKPAPDETLVCAWGVTDAQTTHTGRSYCGWATPMPWAKYLIQLGGNWGDSILFLGILRSSPAGPARLVCVSLTGTYQSSGPPKRETGPTDGKCLLVHVYSPQTLWAEPKLIRRIEGLGFRQLIAGVDLRTHVFVARADPADSSRCVFKYDNSREGGTIELRLMADDDMQLKVLDGPAWEMATSVSSTFPIWPRKPAAAR